MGRSAPKWGVAGADHAKFLGGVHGRLAVARSRKKTGGAGVGEGTARLRNHGRAEGLFNLCEGAKLRWCNAGHFNGDKSITKFLQARRGSLILCEDRAQNGLALNRRPGKHHRFIGWAVPPQSLIHTLTRRNT